MYAKFHKHPMMGSRSKIGGTEMSGEREREQEQEKLLLLSKSANFKQSPNPNQIEFRHTDFGIVILMVRSVHMRGFKSLENLKVFF